MQGINYNSASSQVGFRVRNLIEDQQVKERWPNRYWMTLSIDGSTTEKWQAQATLSDESIALVWDRQIRKYFRKAATQNKSNLICIWGVDNLQSFHSVVLSEFPIVKDCWMKNWPFSKQSWVNRADSRRVFGKMIETYDGSRNAIPYIFHHHQPSVSYVRHRTRTNRKNPPVVNAILEQIRTMRI